MAGGCPRGAAAGFPLVVNETAGRSSRTTCCGNSVGVTGFEPATTRPPDAYSNRAELHPELRLQSYDIIRTGQAHGRFFHENLRLWAKIPRRRHGADVRRVGFAIFVRVRPSASRSVFPLKRSLPCGGAAAGRWGRGAEGQLRPVISPFTTSMWLACGSLGRPGMRIMSPAMATIISLPALMTTSRMRKSKPSAAP